MDAKIKQFLLDNQHNSFFATLLSRSQRRTLSEREIACIERNMKEAVEMMEPAPAGTVFSLPVGSKIEIKRGVANRIKDERKMPIFFRNLEVVQVLRETQKAYLVDVRFISTVATSCHICGLDLDTEISRACGIGPVCAKKHLGVVRPTVENAKEILQIVDNLCQRVGIVEKVWIPKSQILGVFEYEAGTNVIARRKLEEILQTQQPTAKDVWEQKQKLAGVR